MSGEIICSRSVERVRKETFLRIPLYCYSLENKDPTMVSHINTDDNNQFKYFFVAIDCTIRILCTHFLHVIKFWDLITTILFCKFKHFKCACVSLFSLDVPT